MKRTAFLLICILFAAAFKCWADSLWSESSKSLFADRRARAVGDIVTVLVMESTSSSQSASVTGDSSVKSSSALA
ncbi:MAG: flagellar basal body L-ring protein FlgH, partial [Armatimonadota bacterium]